MLSMYRSEREYALLVAGSAEQVRERLAEYAGVEHLVLRVAAPDLATQREQLALLRPGT